MNLYLDPTNQNAMRDQLLYEIALTQLYGLGPINLKRMVAHCGSPKAFFEKPLSFFQNIPGIGLHTLRSMKKTEALLRAEQELKWLENNHVRSVFYTESDYPRRLKHCEDSPLMLFIRGEVDLNQPKVIAIVGTRNMTDYGRNVCEQIITELYSQDVLIVSGLAHGIDAQAHHLSLRTGLKTVGVLGNGLQRIYPAIHRGLSEKMVKEGGGLVTEFLSDMLPNRENFPRRNRIVAGMVDAVVVVEAAKRGGALITAQIAHSYNRDVFALPGRIGDDFSEGCINLIKSNMAQLISSGQDIIESLNWDITTPKKEIQKQLFVSLSPEEELLLNLLESNEAKGIDHIALGLQQSIGQLSPILLGLELKGLIRLLPGNRCMKC